MTGAFRPNGPQDLQRHPQWGIPKDSVVPAFVSSASYHLGSVTRQAGLPKILSEIGGGTANRINVVKRLFGNKSDPVDTSGDFWGLSKQNYANFSKGFSDVGAAGNGAPLVNDFGYRPQVQYPAGQIGDGNGLGVGDWRFSLVGIDPMNPTQPVPPPLTDSNPVRRLVSATGNTSPASSAAPVAPSDRNSFGDRFGNWTSSPEGITPRNPNQPVPSPEPGRPLGIFTGKPMPLWATPLPIWGPPADSNASGNSNWFTTLGGVLGNGQKSPASAINAGATAPPIAPPDSSNSSGGIADWIAALAGTDPQNPSQPAQPPLDDGLRGFYRDDPRQPWFVRGRR